MSSKIAFLEMLKKLYQPKYLLVIPLAIFFIFGLYNISNYITADEHFWLFNVDDDRVNQYWNAILEGNWKNTRINDKPGITLAYTSGVALLFQKSLENQVVFNDDIVKVYDPEVTKRINFLFRLPILIISGLSALMFFWLIKKITDNDWIALFASTLILLSPVLLGMSQIVNPDSLFWIFSSLSILTFFSLLKNRKKKFVVLTGIFFGLAMASKYVSLILVPFYFFMILAYYLVNWERLSDEKGFGKLISINIGYYWAILVGGIVLFSLLMPAVFVKPDFLYSGTIGFSGMKAALIFLIPLNLILLADNLFFNSRVTKAVYVFCHRYKTYLISL